MTSRRWFVVIAKMKLKYIISTYMSGDWGNERSSIDSLCAVYCERSADIVPITNNNYENILLRCVSERSDRLLQPVDLIIEKSGCCPTQSTGRVVYITPELIDSKKNILCSDFCVAFRVKEKMKNLCTTRTNDHSNKLWIVRK